MKPCVVIPFKRSTACRERSLRFNLMHYRALGLQTVLVEQVPGMAPGDVRVHNQTDFPCTTHLLWGAFNGFFERSGCFNVGAAWADKKIGSRTLLFADGDVYLHHGAVFDALRVMEPGSSDRRHVVSPYNRILDLTEQQSDDFMMAGRPPGGATTAREGINLTGGAVFFTTACWEALGGWDERMKGWGGEDDVMTHKVLKLGVPHAEIQSTAWHLWHLKGDWGPEEDAQYRRNWAHLETVWKLGKTELEEFYREDCARLIHLLPGELLP